MMAIAYGMPTLVRIGRAAGLPIDPPVLLMELLTRSSESPPDISIRRQEYMGALGRLHPLLPVPDDQRERCWRRYAWIRSGYDKALCGMAGLTMAAPAEWTTDRPATVSRPRILSDRPINVDWSPHRRERTTGEPTPRRGRSSAPTRSSRPRRSRPPIAPV